MNHATKEKICLAIVRAQDKINTLDNLIIKDKDERSEKNFSQMMETTSEIYKLLDYIFTEIHNCK